MSRASDYFSKSWNEQDWEKQLRKEDAELSSYCHKLPGYIDLPDEEEMWFKCSKSLDASCQSAGNAYRHVYDDDNDLDIENNNSGRNTPEEYRPGAELIDKADLLASEWNILSINKIPRKFRLNFIEISCLFGKLLNELLDFADADPENDRGLKVCLIKRALTDVDIIIHVVEYLCEHLPNASSLFMGLQTKLTELKSQIFDCAVKLSSGNPTT